MEAWLVLHQYTLIGVIWMLVLGPAVGNYACSVVYRLPRGQTPFERHPFCGHCNADLTPRDLFPIISWCMTGGACRHCGGTIPSIYTVIEFACAAVFIGYFLVFGIGESFLLHTAYAVFVIILAAIQWQQGWISSSIMTYALTAIALVRTLHEGTMYGWVQGGFVMLVIALSIHLLNASIRGTRFDPFTTPWIWWMVVMGALVPLGMWKLLCVPLGILFLFHFAAKQWRPWVLIPITTIALCLPLILP